MPAGVRKEALRADTRFAPSRWANMTMEVDQKTLLWRGNSNTTSTNLLYPGSDDLFREIASLDPLALAYSDQTTMITSRKERSTT